MTTCESERITLNEANSEPFEAIRRGYELEVNTPRAGETVFTALGEYALYRQYEKEPWQLLPRESYSQDTHYKWANAESLRTWAGEGTFSPAHMDLVDATLFREQRVTNETTKLTIASEAELRTLLADYAVVDQRLASVHRLYNDIKASDASEEVENITLHLINKSLWLSTAQTMVNVYHSDEEGNSYKLQETDISYFDDQGDHQRTAKSKLRSSLGETGQIIGSRPERPFDTARRGLLEELGLEDDNDIARIISIGSLLRLKEAGHHHFKPIKAEDRTHYFKVDLNPQAVRPEYINEERDASGQLRARIKLEWFLQES